MAEWSTYSLSDFLMFSPEAYWRLVARYNAAWWPAQVLAQAAGVALGWGLARGAARPALVLLALAWAWAGWAFAWQHYAEIFLAAGWLAGACGVQAGLLLAATALPLREQRPTAWRVPGWLLAGAALLYPLLPALLRRPWSEAEVFGFMPDPTALATLGALLLLPRLAPGARVLLAVVPLLAVALGAATRWLLA